MQWPEKLEILCRIYADRGSSQGTETLNDAESTLYHIPAFVTEMNNGGFQAFFYNSTGASARATVDALARIGAHPTASLLSEAIRIYFAGRTVPSDHYERRRLLTEIDADGTTDADGVHRVYFDCDALLTDLLLAYAQANEMHLRLTESEVPTAIPLQDNWRQCPKCHDAWQHEPNDKLAPCPTCHTLTLIRA